MKETNASNKVIDEIAFQADILALNAALEPASEREAAMSFAVAADKARNLAQRNTLPGKEIL